jgi:hypothetical protein
MRARIAGEVEPFRHPLPLSSTELFCRPRIIPITKRNIEETIMGLGKGALLWLIGVPIPIILLIAVFMHH